MSTGFYVLRSSLAQPDNIVLGPAEVDGTYWGAYARIDLEVDDFIGYYSAAKQRKANRITHPSDPPSDGSYVLERMYKGRLLREDAYQVDSCHARGVNEAMSEADENCAFIVYKGRLGLIATANPKAATSLQTRYGFRYWMNSKWPLKLLKAMYHKYTAIISTDETCQDTITQPIADEWARMIKRKEAEVQRQRLARPASILKVRTQAISLANISLANNTPTTRAPARDAPSLWQRQRQAERRKAKTAHRKAVQNGLIPPLRPALTPSDAPSLLLPNFLPQDWCHKVNTDIPAQANLCQMAWSCFGALCAHHNRHIPAFLRFVVHMIDKYSVDIMWLNDARFLEGELDQYLPAVRQMMPDCQIFQFPTYRVATSSRTEMMNRMGGGIAIVNYKWKGYVTLASPDPMGLGLLNTLDIKTGCYEISCINAYFPPHASGTGRATLHARISRHQHRSHAPAWVKKQSPYQYMLGLAQQIMNKRREKGHLVMLCGDLNASFKHGQKPTSFEDWISANQLTAPLDEAFRHHPEYHTRRSNSETQSNTAIDHVLHSPLPESIKLQSVGTVFSHDMMAISDHHPIWINIKLLDVIFKPPLRKPLPLRKRCELNIRDQDKVDDYNEALQKRLKQFPSRLKRTGQTGEATCSAAASGRAVAATLRASVEIVEREQGLKQGKLRKLQQQCKMPRSAKKDCFSPEFCAIKAYMEFYIDLRRLAFPPECARRNMTWCADSYIGIITRCATIWTKKHSNTLRNIGPSSPVATLASPPQIALLPFHQITYQRLQQRIVNLKSMIHGRQREEYRRNMGKEVRKMEDLRQRENLGRLIELLSGKPREQLDLQTLPSAEEGQIVDHHRNQATINEFFRAWHAIPPDLDAAAQHLSTHPLWWQSLLHLDPDEAPRILNKRSAIPEALQKGLRRVCAKKVTQEVEDEVREVVYAPITIEDFGDALDDIVTGGAPGLSLATANMVKGWSDEVRRFVFMHMNNIWMQRQCPTWIKDKVLKLAPKIPGNAALKNMRPISLYEIIRKVWTTTIAKRIHLVWHNRNVPHQAQYGYRLDQGTMMPLLNVINQIEGANVSKISKHVTFWDIRRAFDSVPRNLQKLSWMRLGVPKDVAMWFIELDDGGLSFLDTPLFANTKTLRSSSDMLSSDGHMSGATNIEELSFQAERGIGQGESASSLMWLALYDILLEWIDPRNTHLHVDEALEYTADDARNATPYAYADDLATMTCGDKAEYMQGLQAQWLAAFCAFSGLVMHPDKIKSTIVGPIPAQYNANMTTYDHQWRPVHCRVDVELRTYKYLGVHLDLRCRSTDSFERVRQDAAARLSHLLIQPGSPQAKIDYIRFKIIPIVLYTAQVSNWSLAQYRGLDAPFTETYRKLLSLPRHSPETIIYLPSRYCGIGLPRVSNKAQIQKWNTFLRCSALGGRCATTINNFFDRIPQKMHPRQTPIKVIQPHYT